MFQKEFLIILFGSAKQGFTIDIFCGLNKNSNDAQTFIVHQPRLVLTARKSRQANTCTVIGLLAVLLAPCVLGANNSCSVGEFDKVAHTDIINVAVYIQQVAVSGVRPYHCHRCC